MTFVKSIEDRVDQLATTASYSQDKQQVQLLREALFGEAFEILNHKLNEKVAYRFADRVLASARQELKQRRAAAEAAAASATAPAANT
jgi:hypothetical protein